MSRQPFGDDRDPAKAVDLDELPEWAREMAGAPMTEPSNKPANLPVNPTDEPIGDDFEAIDAALRHAVGDENVREDRLGVTAECPVCHSAGALNVVRIRTGMVSIYCDNDCDEDAIRHALTPAAIMAARLARMELAKLRARRDARRLLEAEQADQTPLPALARLDAFLDTPDEPVAYRIDSLWPSGGRVILAAPHKSGKSTLVGNVSRCLADGDRFLSQFDVKVAERIILVDDELDERMLRSWLRDQGVEHPERVEIVALRGRLSTFDITNQDVRARWAQHLGPADVIILDCLRPILDAIGLDENLEAGIFLVALDELCREAGIGEALVVHHTGHAGERARGSSRILDWPDAIWSLKRDANTDDMAGAPRYLSAYGRDVELAESLLGFDAFTRRLTIAGGSRRDALADDALGFVVEVLRQEPGLSKNAVWLKLKGKGHPQHVIRDAIKRGLKNGQLVACRGDKNSDVLNLPEVSSSVRQKGLNEQGCSSSVRYNELTSCPAQLTSMLVNELGAVEVTA